MSKTESVTEPRFVNRELSWLQFDLRVLELALDANLKLLERLKFLAISASNLDEFFMVRVGSLKFTRSVSLDPSGMSPQAQLAAIRERVIELNSLQDRCLLEQLDPQLAAAGIARLHADDLTESRMRFLRQFFHEEVSSIVSPIAVVKGRPITVMKGARLCVCVRLAAQEGNKLLPATSDQGEVGDRYCLIPIPSVINRIVVVPSERGLEYIFLEEIIGLFLPELFPTEVVQEWTTLRITRNADFELDDDTDDFLTEMEELLDLRAKSKCIRLRVAHKTSAEMREFLRQAFELDADDVYDSRAPLDLSALMFLANHPRFPELRDPSWTPVPVFEMREGENLFQKIEERDHVLFHPYQSFDPVVEFIRQAANDPQVIAIKQTLYRTSRFSKLVRALAEASENGKHVTAIVELKARFDEERNMDWAQFLERAGVDVIYGVVGYKVHAKLCIVVRREKSGIRRYVHFGTGNYNESTAGLYSDISLFTCDHQLGMDAVHAVNAITGLSVPQSLGKLSLAPISLRETLMELIEVEKANASAGEVGQISIKLNSLVDPAMIDSLYEASQCGVKIRLNVRGICCLRPGVPGLSENIRVVSVVDRFLEHSRILSFRHGGDYKVYIASADWMGRNLDRRIEVLVPVEDSQCRAKILEVLDAYFSDNVHAWEIQPDGKHRRLTPGKKAEFRSQKHLCEIFQEEFDSAVNPRTTVFNAIRGKE
jgi:polyphosphate kinase